MVGTVYRYRIVGLNSRLPYCVIDYLVLNTKTVRDPKFWGAQIKLWGTNSKTVTILNFLIENSKKFFVRKGRPPPHL